MGDDSDGPQSLIPKFESYGPAATSNEPEVNSNGLESDNDGSDHNSDGSEQVTESKALEEYSNGKDSITTDESALKNDLMRMIQESKRNDSGKEDPMDHEQSMLEDYLNGGNDVNDFLMS